MSTPIRCACARLRRASRAVSQLYDDALAPAELRVTQFELLRTLLREDAMPISAIASRLLLDRTALSRNLDPLAARGLVSIAPGSDARTRVVRLTNAGRRVLADAEPHWMRAQHEVSRRVGDSRLATLYDLLEDLERLHPARARS